jgi:nucleoid DNA-binding protein
MRTRNARQYRKSFFNTIYISNSNAEKSVIFFRRAYYFIYKQLKKIIIMSIFYNRLERGNPGDPSASKKWYPVLKSTGMVKEHEVAKLLADETTLLLNGNTVQLGGLGSFRVTAATEGSDTEAEVTAAKIKKLNLRFTESEDLKDLLKKATFKDAATLQSK